MLPSLTQIERDTIQVLPDAQKNPIGLQLFATTQRGPLLPPWATRERERRLREVYRADYNWMVQGAFTAIGSVVASTPRQLVSDDRLTSDEAKFWKSAYKATNGSKPLSDNPQIDYFNHILEQADFGRGLNSFIKKVSLNYLRHDCGAFVEVIAPGNPLKSPTGPATGLAVLDSLRCIPTGDPVYPVIYYDRNNAYHLLHYTRVSQLVDAPDTDEYHPGYGLCALSRAISITMREILMGRYIEAKLDDKPPPGIVVAKGMVQGEREKALSLYTEDINRDELPPWGKQLWFFAADPNLDVGLEPISFTQAPEKFDWKQYTEVDIDALALAIGVDRQDLWQLSGHNIGSAGQSEMLAQKSRGKTIGNLRDGIERIIDGILPDGIDFEFQFSDAQEDTERAGIAKVWADTFKALSDSKRFTDDELRLMLAEQVEAVKEAISDDKGNIQPFEAPPPPVAAPSPFANAQPGSNPVVSGQGGLPDTGGTAKALRERPRLHADLGGLDHADSHETVKAIQSTLIDFEDAFADLIDTRVKGDINSLRFGVIARDLLRRYGLQALRDGLEAGGVPQTDDLGQSIPLDTDDALNYLKWLGEQSVYVTDFGRTLTRGAQVDGESRAEVWGNKSIMSMFDSGRLSADRNGMYLFTGDDGAESCVTCQRLKEQVHRMKDWERRKLRPGVDTQMFECGGWRCQHVLVKTTDRARGRF